MADLDHPQTGQEGHPNTCFVEDNEDSDTESISSPLDRLSLDESNIGPIAAAIPSAHILDIANVSGINLAAASSPVPNTTTVPVPRELTLEPLVFLGMARPIPSEAASIRQKYGPIAYADDIVKAFGLPTARALAKEMAFHVARLHYHSVRDSHRVVFRLALPRTYNTTTRGGGGAPHTNPAEDLWRKHQFPVFPLPHPVHLLGGASSEDELLEAFSVDYHRSAAEIMDEVREMSSFPRVTYGYYFALSDDMVREIDAFRSEDASDDDDDDDDN
ncbi:hypothetical protein COL26b_007511 [Colletotrichum chrysophilum]|nr:uncharacterized protein COL26b_007511 [Colletotrichum chrysophilum]KAJ0374265.1 hypothetical protein COL26b_007511 [Colletotrichum chrysophilum]